MKKFVSMLLALVMVFALCACGSKTEDGDKAESIKVGFICLHDENSTYDKNFIDAAKAACKNAGLSEDQYIIKTNIPEGQECYNAAAELVDAGCNVVFADSFGHEDFMIQAAKDFPKVQFCHATGTKAHTEKLSNYHNAFASIYEGRYLAGVAAGMKLNEMIEAGDFTADQAKMGLEKVPTDTEYLFVSNHRSNFDPMVQWWVLRRWRLAFVSKPSNMRKFVIGPFVRRCCFLPIDRENARNALTTINAAADLIRAHECSFAIYPEGTRSKSGELLPWHAGSLKIAQKANVPIVVATIEGTERIAHNVPWRRTHVYLSIREVIPAETVKATKTNALTEGIRSKMIAELGK